MTTMANESNEPTSIVVEGFKIPATFSEKVFRSALKYKPRPDDVFIATYPKCGSTWMGNILTPIFRKGEYTSTPLDIFTTTPFLEASGAESVEKMARPNAIKTHLPFRLVPWSPKAKYINVARNPKDCCVSFYYHMTGFDYFNSSFDEFFELFLSGEIELGDYFDHLCEWYKHKDDPNVFFITYEQLKEDIKGSILRTASFLGEEEYAKPLKENEKRLNNVIYYSSFDYMKQKVNKDVEMMMYMKEEELEKSTLPDGMKEMLLKTRKEKLKDSTLPKSVNFVRKGVIGDWQNHLSPEQSKRLDEKFMDRTKDTGIPELWKKYM